ncbi:MAG: glycoside hydrolase family 1 protein [Patescibacteria group bacterium]|nr:glycoside hydrolase family 1 protein [Patescibacteria group bacterium]
MTDKPAIPGRLEGLDYLSELPQPRPHNHEPRMFPSGFLWGAATSSHQVEGGNTKNDWYRWEQVPGHIVDGSVTGAADDEYNRYEQDFDLAAGFHQNAHRLSLEWSRIEPAEGQWDMEEVLHYRRVLEALRARGMTTMVTIWHFTLPQWFADRGGWEERDAVKLFVRYVEFVARELGDLVDFWNTVNEPTIYLGQSYSIGVWPPGVSNQFRMLRVFRRLAKAHSMAYETLHRVLDGRGRPVMVGMAQNVITFEPYRKESMADSYFVWFADRLFNHQFFLWTKKRHDFIGINYYFHYRIKYVPTKFTQFFYEVHAENRTQSDLGWEINPQGIFQAIMGMARYKLPIIITEHGVANADDSKRPRMIIAALMEVYHAIRAGVDIRGYFHWSLVDNFEWEKGFSGRFGLIAVDFATQKRTPRRSAYVYAEICETNGVPHHLLRFTGHGVRW